jgi:hypothetical protein
VADYIPFVASTESRRVATTTFDDAAAVRIPFTNADRLLGALPSGMKVWLDPCLDGCDDLQDRKGRPGNPKQWFDCLSQFPFFESLGSSTFVAKPIIADVNQFVFALMTRCAAANPAWITVPQLPVCKDSERNRINRALAAATGRWKSSSKFSGRLILPLIFTHQLQVTSKTERNPRVQLAEKCYHESQADGLWVVDKSLTDDNGSPTLRNKRFPSVIALHEELSQKVPTTLRIAGPYWALNLVLWARGLVDHPAIGVGSGYQYLLSGGPITTASIRIAIPSLRRRVEWNPDLRSWFDRAMTKLGSAHPAHSEFQHLKSQLTALNNPARSREQVCEFYKQWYHRIASAPKGGRAMALFQDLSAAYALGKTLPPIDSERAARRPEAIAESLMMSCL